MALEIPIEWLVGLVVTGVPGVVLLAHLTGGSRAARLDEGRVRRAVAEQVGEAVGEVVLGEDGTSALVQLANGGSAMCWVKESHVAAREVRPEDLRGVDDTGAGLVLFTRDAGCPRIVVALTEPVVREAWATRLVGRHRGAA